MSRGTLKLVIFATFSSIFTVLTVLLAIHSASIISVYNSRSTTVVNGASQAEFMSPFFPTSLGISVIGWLLTGYELFAERRKEISRIIRTTFSGKRDHWNLYNIFKGKGGVRRLTILETLSVPRQRNEVARITNTDWKEVDRNFRILESANLIKTTVSKTPFPLYVLTDEGKDLLETISNVVES